MGWVEGGEEEGEEEEGKGGGWILESRCRIRCWKETDFGRTRSVGQRLMIRCQCL
jgi:hypothetical protein